MSRLDRWGRTLLTPSAARAAIGLSAAGVRVRAARALDRPSYSGYFKKRPFSSQALPIGTSAINESILNGGVVSRSIDSVAVFNGRPTTKLTVTSAGTSPNLECGLTGASFTLDADAQQLLSRQLAVAVRVGPGNAISTVVLYLGDAGYTNFSTWEMGLAAQIGEWAIYVKAAAGASTTAGTPNFAAAVRGKVRVVMTGNVQPGDVWISSPYVLPAPDKTVVLTFDDAYSEWTWLAAEAAKRGIPIAFGMASDYVGTAGFLTESEVRSIANNYNGLHVVTNHARVNDSYNTLGLAAYLSHVEYCRDWLVARGCDPRGASLHQYVQGFYDQSLINALKARGYLSCREVGASNRPSRNSAIAAVGATSDELYKLPATVNLDVTQNLATVQSYLTNSSATGTAFVMGHRLAAAAGSITWVKGYDDNHGVLNLLEWLAERRDVDGWRIPSWLDWHEDMTNPRFAALV